MSKKTKAQFAIEFVVLIAFMFLIFVGFISVVASRVIEARENEREKVAEDIAILVRNEVELAESATDGYTRTFNIPSKVSGNKYTIEIINNRELVVNYVDKEHVLFLPEKICGDIYMPDNEIDKEDGIICANSNFDETQCQNAETFNLCDVIEPELLPGTKCCCCARYGLCCPQCNDGLDNEPDGFIDLNDPQCANWSDDDESG